jgi:hypothetical protein
MAGHTPTAAPDVVDTHLSGSAGKFCHLVAGQLCWL